MKKYLVLRPRFGETLKLELVPDYYPFNRTLAIELMDGDKYYDTLTCCLDDAPGKNCAYIDVIGMGSDIVLHLEDSGFGRLTGKTCQSGYVIYPEFEFDADILEAYMNKNYHQYLKWQDQLKEDEEFIRSICEQCLTDYTFIVKKGTALKYREYDEGRPYQLQDIFTELTDEERGLFARGRKLCGACFKEQLHLKK